MTKGQYVDYTIWVKILSGDSNRGKVKYAIESFNLRLKHPCYDQGDCEVDSESETQEEKPQAPLVSLVSAADDASDSQQCFYYAPGIPREVVLT